MLARQTFLNLVFLIALLSGVAVASRYFQPQEAVGTVKHDHLELRDRLESQIISALEAHPEVVSVRVRLSRLERCCYCDENMWRAFEAGLYTCRVLLELAPGYTPPESQVRAWKMELVSIGGEVRLKSKNCVIIDSTGRVLTPP